MDKIKIRFDPSDNTLIVWFDDPRHMAYLSPIEEESEGELHLIKNEAGYVIGLECHFYHLPAGSLGLETENSPLILPHA